VEIHRGKDGNLYAIDLHRLFPPSSEEQQKFLFQHFRPEFMARWARRGADHFLNSDVFSGFTSFSDPRRRADVEKARNARRFLEKDVIPECAKQLESTFAKCTMTHCELIALIHRAGVNVRYIGRVFRHLKSPYLIQLVCVEMCARIVKVF
jgi:hypothetical protein